jgi:molybdopterin-guanine dinucleotide biosynthesis protein MobB
VPWEKGLSQNLNVKPCRWTENITLPLPIISVVGSQQSGKTATVEALTRGLTEKGYRVATAKHIPEIDFTIDTKKKDTWRHAQAGANIVFSVAPKELTVIRKVETAKLNLDFLVQQCENEADVLILEGFKKLVAKNLVIPKIVTIKNSAEFAETQRVFKPILAFAAPSDLKDKGTKIPVVDALREPEKLVEIVDKRVGPIILKRKTEKDELNIRLDERILPLNPFVQQYVRNVVLAMLSELKTAKIKGNETVSIRIKKKE